MANLKEQFNQNVASIHFSQGLSQDDKLCMSRFSIPPPQLPHDAQSYFSQSMVAQNILYGLPPSPNLPGENRYNRHTLHDLPYPQYFSRFPPPSNMSNIYNPTFPPPHGYFTRPSFPQLESNNFSQGHNSQPPPFRAPSPCYEDYVLNNLDNEGLQQQRMQDELWVNDFLTKIGPLDVLNPSMLHHEEPVKELKIFEAQQRFKTYINLLEELQILQEEMAAECGSLSLETWERKCEDIEMKRTEMSKYLDELCNPATLQNLKKKLDGRKKKRKAEKRRRAERHGEVVEAHARRLKLDKHIDSWLEEMKESVEKSKREENLKYDADQVLFDVTHKKAEAKCQVELLTNLVKLRQLKAQAAASRGQPVSTESADGFEKPIEHLCNLWKDQLKDYNLEEQGLRVMLEEAAEKRNKKHLSIEKRASIEWDRALFGDKIYWDDEDAYNSITAANTSLEAFVDVRKSWDKFVVPESTITSSSMPVGWVVPVCPSSPAWQAVVIHEAFLKNIPTSATHQTTSQ